MDLKPSEALAKIRDLATEVSLREKCLLYDLELSGVGKGRCLQVFIEDETGSVSVDQCANVSRGLSLLLDVEDLVDGDAYELEVSSPGLERRLTQFWHFEKILNEEVRVELNNPIQALLEKEAVLPKVLKGRKKLKGKVRKAEGGMIVLESETGSLFQFSPSQIKKANIWYDFDRQKGKK